MTGKELLMKAADLGPIEGAVLIQTAINDDSKLLTSLVRAAGEYKSADGGLREDTPPNVATFLRGTDALLGGL